MDRREFIKSTLGAAAALALPAPAALEAAIPTVKWSQVQDPTSWGDDHTLDAMRYMIEAGGRALARAIDRDMLAIADELLEDDDAEIHRYDRMGRLPALESA